MRCASIARMRPPSRTARRVAAGALLAIVLGRPADAITLAQTGFAADALCELPGVTAQAIQVDGAGMLYVPADPNGIVKVAPDGTKTPWSAVNTPYLAIASGGDGYAIGAWPCRCILRLSGAGVSSTLVPGDSLDWIGLAVGPDGSLWANGWVSGGRDGIYRIDTVTGERTLVVEGGPAPVASTIYGALAFGTDGQLYALGTVYGVTTESRLFRLDGTQMTEVANLPHGGTGLARGKGSSFYVTTAFDYGSGYAVGEVWAVESSDGSSALFASSGPDQNFFGVGYSPNAGKLYIGERAKRLVLTNDTIWRISGDSLPVRLETWGSVKSRYRDGAR